MNRPVAIARSLSRDERGTSVIELGLFAPILAVMVMGITDLSMGYARKLAVEQAAFRALEQVQVGSEQTSYAFVQAEAATAAGVPAGQVAVDHWRECDRVRQPTVAGACTSGQETSVYVSVTINTTYTPSFSFSALPTVNGVVPITASASVRVR